MLEIFDILSFHQLEAILGKAVVAYDYSILRTEIEFLEQAVSKEREKYQLSTQALSAGLSAIPVMAINDSVIMQLRPTPSCGHFPLILIVDFIIC